MNVCLRCPLTMQKVGEHVISEATSRAAAMDSTCYSNQ
jgi:hypothetical protein